MEKLVCTVANEMGLREAVSRAAEELIVFIYDVIVESRRRSLREMYVAARRRLTLKQAA